VEPLTSRENQVLDHLAYGISNREIGELLAIGVRTVETHLSSIYGKLGVCGRMQAILWTLRERQEPWSAAVGAFAEAE
jgi:DNA-binding NarL/FixJ family response regulator